MTRRTLQRSGDFYLATSGDFLLATTGDFFMAMDNRSVTMDLPVTGSAVHGRARHGVQRADRVAARGTCSPQGKRL